MAKSTTTATVTSPAWNIFAKSLDLEYVLTIFGFNSSSALKAASPLSSLRAFPPLSAATDKNNGPPVVVISGIATLPFKSSDHKSLQSLISRPNFSLS